MYDNNIRHGEAVGIIGPSGTGKSTILKIMAGLLTPDKGEVFIRGRRRHGLISDDEISGLRIGMSAALFDSLTVRENVGFLLYENSSMSENQIAILVSQTLAAVGLKGVEDRLPSELSSGMKKRVALARSIIFDTTKDVIEPEEEDLGTISLGILYSSFAVFSLVASLVVQFLGSKNALVLGNTRYWLFIAANLIPTWTNMLKTFLLLKELRHCNHKICWKLDETFCKREKKQALPSTLKPLPSVDMIRKIFSE
ncbi:hypothetical protein ACSBR2_034370 [Camellia fascicularis]